MNIYKERDESVCPHCRATNTIPVVMGPVHETLAAFWECLHCGGTWQYWSKYDACGVHDKAVPYIHGRTR